MLHDLEEQEEAVGQVIYVDKVANYVFLINSMLNKILMDVLLSIYMISQMGKKQLAIFTMTYFETPLL